VTSEERVLKSSSNAVTNSAATSVPRTTDPSPRTSIPGNGVNSRSSLSSRRTWAADSAGARTLCPTAISRLGNADCRTHFFPASGEEFNRRVAAPRC
jgi:hypothetical protein